jgi:hypothetical protein
MSGCVPAAISAADDPYHPDVANMANILLIMLNRSQGLEGMEYSE